MSNKRTLLSLAVAAGLGAVSLQASAAPTVYGDLSFALVYTGAYTDTGAGKESSYALSDNVSLLGVKGEAAKIGSTSYFYDFNFILDGGKPNTHLAVVGMDGDFGKVSIGTRINGLFVGMVDGGTYLTNWYYTPGMSSLQVSNGITYETKSMSGLTLGVQAFDLAKDKTSGETTTNYTLAGTYGMGALTFGLGYTSYSDYADGTTQYSASADTNMFGDGQNVYSGVNLKSVTGGSVAYKADKFSVIFAYDMRKPNDGNANTDSINTAMLTGSYAISDKLSLAANYSNTDQSGTAGKKGSIITAMISYAPADSILYTFEIQNSDKDANASSITGTTGAGGTKSNTGFAAGMIYNF